MEVLEVEEQAGAGRIQVMLFKNKKLEKRVAELEAEIDDLKLNLIHDYLTGAKTRAFFQTEVGMYLKALEKGGARSQRRENFGFKNLSLLFIDIDKFKSINDTYGHEVGDEVLQSVAHAIEANLRAEDTLARWGGEEFVICLLGATEENAKHKADELREKVSQLKFEKPSDLQVTISVGVASSEEGVELNTLVERGDIAMYEAKKTGRNKVVTHSELDKLKAS